MKKELVIVIDFGGQYNQLVARRVRECNVYCEIYFYKTDLEKIKAMNQRESFLPVDRTVVTKLIHRLTRKNYSNLVFRCLGFATVHSL